MRYVLASVMIAMAIAAAPVRADMGRSRPTELKVLEDLNIQLISWFTSLSNNFDKLADGEDRKILIDRLTSLNRSIYRLETNGRKLVFEIESPSPDHDRALAAVETTRASLIEVNQELERVGLSLRMEYRKGGVDAERLIARSLNTRGIWLSNLSSILAHGRQISPETIETGTKNLEMQASASVSLSQVIAKLKAVK